MVMYAIYSVSTGIVVVSVQVLTPFESHANGAVVVVVAGASEGTKTSMTVRYGLPKGSPSVIVDAESVETAAVGNTGTVTVVVSITLVKIWFGVVVTYVL